MLCKCGCCEEITSKRSKAGFKKYHNFRVYRSPNIFTNGHIAWWELKGEKHPGLENLHPHRSGEFHHSEETKEKLRKIFDRGIAPMTAIRRSANYLEWRKTIFERDNFTCLKCEDTGGRLSPHHLFSFKEYPEKRLEVSNGATVCLDCHKKFHREFGRVNNTPEQFFQFVGVA